MKTASMNKAAYQGMNNFLTLTGIGTAPLPSVDAATDLLIERLYQGQPPSFLPVTEKTASKDERNQLICERYSKGEPLMSLVQYFGVSVQRVH